MTYVFDLNETFVYHQNLLHISKIYKITKIRIDHIRFITWLLSVGFNDDRDSEPNSSGTFLYVAFILSLNDYWIK